MSNLKGNQKGWRKSYRVRRTFVLGTFCLLVTLMVVLLANNSGRTSQKMVSFVWAMAAEVEVDINGEQVDVAYDMAASSTLKGSKPAQEQPERILINEKQQEEEEYEQEEGGEDDVEPDDDFDEGPSPLLLNTFPRLTYGTAWKEDSTARLVFKAVIAGFRHIDTACQPKHYNEAGVGEGWTKAAKDLGLTREDFWLQTKFTSLDGQDPDRVPYDKDASLDEQVNQSLAKSLENLQTTYLDSWVMHGPEDNWDDTLLVWKTMESWVDDGTVRQIGISNLYEFDALKYLYEQARIKPKVVQNRFYGGSEYDVEIRQFCLDHDIEYQSFWTLGANTHALRNEKVKALAEEKDLSPETLMYAFCMAVGITPLDGTTSYEHMEEDLELLERIRTGDGVFADREELSIVAEALEIQGWS